MILNSRRSYVRYLLVAILLIGLYLTLSPWDSSSAYEYSVSSWKNLNGEKSSSDNSGTPKSSKPNPASPASEQGQFGKIVDDAIKEDSSKSQMQDRPAAVPASPAKASKGPTSPSAAHASTVSNPSREQIERQHYSSLFDIFAKTHVDIAKLDNYKDGKKAQRKAFEDKYPIYSDKELGEFLQVSREDMDKLQKSHADVLRLLPDEYPKGLYSGRGVVTVAGGGLLPTLLGTLRLLRKVSPKIPVEIFMADEEEYEPEICEQVFPALGAKCIILKDKIGAEVWDKFKIHGYQYKVLSMLFSSFEDNLFLDADSIPLLEIENLFDEEPYRSKKYVLWPDYWYRTTSPRFYEAAGVTLGKRVRGNLSITDPDLTPQADLENALPDKSNESGQILFNKKEHYKALLLSTYYNLNGHQAYYPLLSQGVSGEGDKETFLAALEVLKHPYQQVKTDLRPAGYFLEGEFKGTGMLQVNPWDDYKVNVLKTTNAKPRIQFMHLNYPKVNAPRLIHGGTFDELYLKDETRRRFIGKPSDNYWVFDYRDIELDLWEQQKFAACDLGLKRGIVFKDWKEFDMETLCKEISDHVSWLHNTHNT